MASQDEQLSSLNEIKIAFKRCQEEARHSIDIGISFDKSMDMGNRRQSKKLKKSAKRISTIQSFCDHSPYAKARRSFEHHLKKFDLKRERNQDRRRSEIESEKKKRSSSSSNQGTESIYNWLRVPAEEKTLRNRLGSKMIEMIGETSNREYLERSISKYEKEKKKRWDSTQRKTFISEFPARLELKAINELKRVDFEELKKDIPLTAFKHLKYREGGVNRPTSAPPKQTKPKTTSVIEWTHEMEQEYKDRIKTGKKDLWRYARCPTYSFVGMANISQQILKSRRVQDLRVEFDCS